MLNRHKDELSLEWDKRWEHLQLGKITTSRIPLPSLLTLSSSPVSFPFDRTNKIRCNQWLWLMNACLWLTVLEVMQFARDAHMAEGWMIAQEPYLKNENLGVSVFLFFLFFLPRLQAKTVGLFPTKERINCRAFLRQWLLVSQRFKLNVSCFSVCVFRPISMKSNSFWRNTQTSRS